MKGRGAALAGVGVLLLASLAAVPPAGAGDGSGMEEGGHACPAVALADLGLPHERAAQAQAFAADLQLLTPAPETWTGQEAHTLDPASATCEGSIRPGARLILEGQHACTANWVFTDSAGRLYIGTAGHCIPTLAWSRVEVPGLGDIGDPVFTTGDQGPGKDFALIRIAPSLHHLVDATLCRWGGPAEPAPTDGAAGGGMVWLYGWGSLYQASPETRARGGVLGPDLLTPPGALAYAAPTSPGDSGAPLLGPDGLALGLHTHSSAIAGVPVAGVGLKFGTTIGEALTRAEAHLGHSLALVRGEAPPGLLDHAPATTP